MVRRSGEVVSLLLSAANRVRRYDDEQLTEFVRFKEYINHEGLGHGVAADERSWSDARI